MHSDAELQTNYFFETFPSSAIAIAEFSSGETKVSTNIDSAHPRWSTINGVDELRMELHRKLQHEAEWLWTSWTSPAKPR